MSVKSRKKASRRRARKSVGKIRGVTAEALSVDKEQALADQARFVFQGTVQKLRAATLKEVPVSDRTVTVRVDQEIQAPDALTDYAGRNITVQLAKGERVKPGDTFIFYTTGWIFGDGLAVQSVGHTDATPTAAAELGLHPDDPVRSLHTREALARVPGADLIVTGHVSSVRVPTRAPARTARLAATDPSSGRISEHDPVWQEAVIDIDEVHKGRPTKKKVIVRFPSSTDVRWHKAPKFEPGQQGVFILRTGATAAAEGGAARMAAIGPEEFTALNAADVQPLDILPQIKSVEAKIERPRGARHVKADE